MAGSSGSASTISKPQRDVMRELGPLLQQMAIEGQATPLEGPLVAPLLEGFTQARDLALGGVQQQQPVFDQQAQTLKQMLEGQTAVALDPQVTQNVWQDAVVTPAMRLFDQQVAPRISSSFAGLGQTFSTRRGQATADALGSLQQDLTGQLAQMVQANQNLQAQLAESARATGLGNIQQFAMQPFQQASGIMSVLAPFQQRTDQQLSMEQSEQFRQMAENSPWLQLAMAFMGTPTRAPSQASGGLGGAIGAGLGALLGGFL